MRPVHGGGSRPAVHRNPQSGPTTGGGIGPVTYLLSGSVCNDSISDIPQNALSFHSTMQRILRSKDSLHLLSQESH
jgi:hypothetical protein